MTLSCAVLVLLACTVNVAAAALTSEAVEPPTEKLPVREVSPVASMVRRVFPLSRILNEEELASFWRWKVLSELSARVRVASAFAPDVTAVVAAASVLVTLSVAALDVPVADTSKEADAADATT